MVPAAAVLAGCGLGDLLGAGPVPLAMAAAALALAGRHRVGTVVGLLLFGLAASWARSGAGPPAGSALDPVTVVGRLTGAWSRDAFGWSVPAGAAVFRQHGRVRRWRQRVILTVPGEEPPPPGLRFRAVGRLRRSPGFANGPDPAPGPWRLQVKNRHFFEARPGSGGLAAAGRLAAGARGAVRRRWADGSAGARLARALLLGERGAVPTAVRRGLRRAGLAHLLAVSGLHVASLAGVLLLAFRPLPPGLRLLPAAAVTCGYLLVVGPRPAILRASLMALLAWTAPLLERPGRGLNSLALAVLALVLADPAASGDLGFRLTASATAGVIAGPRLLGHRWTRLPAVVARPLASSVGAQLCTLPWTAPAFGFVAPAAPLLNLAMIPWTALTLAAALLATVSAPLAPAASRVGGALLDLCARPFWWLGELPARLFLVLPVDVGGWQAAGLAVAAAWVLVRPRRLLPAAGVAAVLTVVSGASGPRPLEMVVLDVGQGEAILLRDGAAAVLVDGGGWRRGDLGGRVLVPALGRLRVRRLRAVALSHPDVDHCGGLVDLVAYLPVDEVWTAPGWPPRGCVGRLLTATGPRFRPLWAGESATAGRWRFRVLHPPPGERRRGNDGSLVLAAEAAGVRVLLTGDLEAGGERGLRLRHPPPALRAEVLKLAHHGSRTSSGEALLDAVRPRLAVVSAGPGNRYGHPSPVVLARLRARGVPLLRTDRDGLIRLALVAPASVRVSLPAAPRLAVR